MSDKKLEQSELDKLITLRNEASILVIKSRTMVAMFNEKLGEILQKMGVSIDDSVLCMTCATIRNLTVQTCPSCNDVKA